MQKIDDSLKELYLIDILLTHFKWRKDVTISKCIAGLLYQFGREKCNECPRFFRGEFCEECDKEITKILDDLTKEVPK